MDDNVIGFDSIESAFAFMEQAENDANARVHPLQNSIGYGEYVLRLTPDYAIFGYVFERAERDKDEDKETIAMLNDGYARGYRFGRWHSEVVPEGELGDTHVYNLWRIFKEEFDLAKAAEFETKVIIQTEWFQNMLRRVESEARSSGRATEANDGAGFTSVQDAL